MNTNKTQAEQLPQVAVKKSVFKYEIERLDSGFLVNKMDIMLNDSHEKCGHKIINRVGVSNIETLEKEINNLLSKHTALREDFYFKNKSKIVIKLSVDVMD